MNKIPKIAHLCWKRRDVVDNQSPLILNGIRNLIDLNPDWEVTIHEDLDVDEYLRSKLDAADYDLIKDRHIVEKSDLWRLIKLYYEGGLYMDIDRFCNCNLSNLLEPGITCVLPTSLDYDFSQDFMLSAPGNPLYLETINLNLSRRREGWKNVYFLGAQTYMHAITKLVCGQVIDTNPGLDTFNKIRQDLRNFPFIKTYRESPPFDTVIYKHDNNIWRGGDASDINWESLKRSLYGQYDIKHWTGEW